MTVTNDVCLFIRLWCGYLTLSLSVILTLIGVVVTLVCVRLNNVRLKLSLSIFQYRSKNVSLNK